MIVLEFRAGPNAGQRVALEREVVRIGGPGCNIVLVDPAVSNPHFEVRRAGGQYEVVDLGSAHGTRIGSPDAKPIRARTVYAVDVGTVVWIGGTALELADVDADRTMKMEPARRPRPSAGAAGNALAERTLRMRQVSRTARTRGDTEVGGVLPVPEPREESNPDLLAPSVPTDAVVLEPSPGDEDPTAAEAPYEGRARLTFTSGPHVGRRVFLGEREVTLGRSDESAVVLIDPRVELRHAVIARDPRGRYLITPRSERAVVRVNSERVTHGTRLENGDVVGVGASDVTFLAAGIDPRALDAAATVAVQEPFFAVGGALKKQRMLTIGRSPEVDLFLDHHRVERTHARVVFRYPDFFLEDLSASGTYVGGERVADRLLADGDEARVGAHRLRFSIQPLRCGVEVLPPENDEEIPRFAADVDAAASYQTLYHLPANLGAEAAERLVSRTVKEAKDRAAVLWVEPHDVRRTWRTAIMAIIAAAMSVAVVAALALRGGESFLRRPLAEGHRSPEFAAELVSHAGGTDSCRGCHGGFEKRVGEACARCHPKSEHPLRPKHEAVAALTARACTGCHTEHQTEVGAPLLVDGASCAAAGCHEQRHAAFFPQTKGPTTRTPTTARAEARRATFGGDLLADVAFDRAKRKTRIHQLHVAAGLEGQCGACHSVNGEERPMGAAWQSCFTCHAPADAQAAMASLKCSECHREHGEASVWATAPGKPGALTARGAGQVAFVLLLLPVGLFFALHHVVIGRRRFSLRPAEPAAAAPKAEAEEMLCDGVSLAEARKLPRLIASKCVGSAECVSVCPYQVLEMAPGKPPKPVVARPELCHECGLCVAKCGPGALVMMPPEEPFPLVDRPAVDANYEISIPGAKGGVYVIGAAAAKPSVKNGINLGYWAVQHAAFEGAFAGAAAHHRVRYELVIVGAGPAGLSAALAAQELGLSYVVLERADDLAGAVGTYPVGKPVQVNPPHPEDPEAPEPDDVSLVGHLWLERDATREDLLERWRTQAEGLAIRFGERVEGLRAEKPGFVVTTARGSYAALKVIIAVGDRGTPRRLGVPGEELPKVKHALDDPQRYAGQHVMVVGGGNSAVEAAAQLARAGCASVRLVYRKQSFTRATPKNRAELEAAVSAGRVQVHLETGPQSIRARSVTLSGAVSEEVPNDVVFALLGWDPPTAWMKRLGIELTKKPADWEPGPSDKPAFLQLGEDRS